MGATYQRFWMKRQLRTLALRYEFLISYLIITGKTHIRCRFCSFTWKNTTTICVFFSDNVCWCSQSLTLYRLSPAKNRLATWQARPVYMQEDASWAYTWDNTVCFNILLSWAFLLCMATLGIFGMSHSWVFSSYCVGRGERHPSLIFHVTNLRMSITEKQSLVTPQIKLFRLEYKQQT